jgi:hypothetical protein
MSNLEEVIGSFASDWQALVAPDKEDEQAAASRLAASGAFHDELGLITNAENLVVLAGLGTSLSIENSKDKAKVAPRMSDLWALVGALKSFDTVKKSLNPALVKSANLEHVLSDAQARYALDTGNTDLKTFIDEAEGVIWESCSFVNDDSQVDTHELFLRKVARRSTRLQRTQIFTTNYDLAFEAAAQGARFNVIDGFGYGGQYFDGASFDLDYVRRRPNEPLALEPSVFHLLKLHGSVDWDATAGEIRKVAGFVKPATPVLIYPSAAKYQLSFQQPYLEFMSRFQIALRQPDVGLIVVGSGLSDEHLVAPIEAALRSNIGLRAVFITPGAKDAKRSATFDWIEGLIRKGDKRLTLLSGTFDDLVRHLPDMPTREERDAHSDRIAQSRGKK